MVLMVYFILLINISYLLLLQVKASQEAQAKDFPEGIPECGADALRFGLLSYTVQGRDVNLDILRVVGYRQFCNKMWNAVRFALTYVADFTPTPQTARSIPAMEGVSRRDLYILHRLNETIADANTNFKAYLFGNVTTVLYSFFMYDVCDTYLELVKPVFSDTSAANAKRRLCAQATLYTVLEQYLRLCHPIMPFVTEELWQRLPNRDALQTTPSIMIATYPTFVHGWYNPIMSSNMELLKETINSARSIRVNYNVGNHIKTDFYFRTENEDIQRLLEGQADDFCTLCRGNFLRVADASLPKGCSVKVISDKLSILMNLSGVVDVAQEIGRLTKDLERLLPLSDNLRRKTEAAGYDKVPDAVKAANADKLVQYGAEIDSIKAAMKEFEEMQ